MADIKIVDSNGNEQIVTVPDFAMEATQRKILEVMEKAYPKDVFKNMQQDMNKLLDSSKKLAKNNDEHQNDLEKIQKDALKAANKLVDQQQKAVKNGTVDPDAVIRYNNAAAMGEKVFTRTYSAVMGVSTALVGMGAVVAGTVLNGFLSVGKELNTLTNVGVGFVESNMTATQALARLSASGLDASAVLADYSNVVATVGKQSFTNLTTSFLDATASGADLAMSLDDAVGRYGEELSIRQQLGGLNNLSVVQQKQLNEQVTKSIHRQQNYSRALGISSDSLQQFSASLLEQTPVLSATLLRFTSDVRGKVTAGISDFATAMKGLGGDEGGQIAAAITEAATMGGLGFSDSLVGYVTALPSLAAPVNQYIDAIQKGTLTQDQANEMAQTLAMNLGNLSQAEKDRVFALARAGDAQAQSAAKAILQFEATESKIKEINKNFTMEDVQVGTNIFNTALKEITGLFDTFKFSFFNALGGVDEAGKTISEAMKVAKKTVVSAISSAMGSLTGATSVFDGVAGSADSLGEKFAKYLPTLIEKTGNVIADVIEAIPGIIEGIKSFSRGFMSVMKVLGLVMTPVVALFKLVGGALDILLAPVEMVADGLGSLFSSVVPSGNDFMNILGKMTGATVIAVGALKLMGSSIPSMLGNMGKNLASKVGSIASSVTDKLGIGSKASSGASSVASSLGSADKSAGKASGGSGFKKLGTGLAGMLSALGKIPLVAIGKVAVILGGVTLAAMGLGKALELASPFVSAFGDVLSGFGSMIKSALQGVGTMFTTVFESVSMLDPVQLVAAAGGITAIGVSLATLGAGKLLDGIASLFSSNPVDKLIELGNVAPSINDLTGSMGIFGEAVDKFNTGISNLDGTKAKDELTKMSEGFANLDKAVNTMGTAAKVDPLGGADFKTQFNERKFAQNDPENYEKFVKAREEAIDKAIAESMDATGSYGPGVELLAKVDTIRQFAPQIQAAGAGTFTNPETGQPIRFNNTVNTPVPVQPPTPRQPAVESPLSPLQPVAEQQPTTSTPVASNASNMSSDLLTQLLEETRKQNKLLRQQVAGTNTIASQI